MLIPMSTIFYKIFNRDDTPYLIIGTSFGIAAGIFYVLGLMRWVFLADDLSKKYIDENINVLPYICWNKIDYLLVKNELLIS